MAIALRVRIVHQIAGRTRLVLLDQIDAGSLDDCVRRLAATGLARAEVRPNSRSLLLRHPGPWAALEPALAEAGFVLYSRGAATPIGMTRSTVARLDRALSTATAGRLDLANAAFLGLLGAGAVQVARGQLVGPALTLFTQALTLATLHAASPTR